jgi:Stress up-regulated Nod 19
LTAGASAAGLGFQIPAGKSSKSSKTFEIRQDGTIVNARAHMHDGGEGIKLYINEKLACDSKAVYGGNPQAMMIGPDGKKWETISSMKECIEPIQVKKGDGLRMEAYFDTDTHPV